MKAYRVSRGTEIEPLPLPVPYRKGDMAPEPYRRQASGEIPRANQNLGPARFVRTIRLKDGRFSGLAGETGALLSFVISGQLTLTVDGSETTLLPGDLFLVDEDSAARIGVGAHDGCRLVQIGVAPDWPGPDAKIQIPGTAAPRKGGETKIKRIIQKGDLAYFREFPELFSAPPNEWSPSRPSAGFRFLLWEDGFLDWHPNIVNGLAVIMSGELEIETSGDHVRHIFNAGDLCLCEDRTGMGHIDWIRGATHICVFVISDEDLW